MLKWGDSTTKCEIHREERQQLFYVKVKSKEFPDLYHIIEIDLHCYESMSEIDLDELKCEEKMDDTV